MGKDRRESPERRREVAGRSGRGSPSARRKGKRRPARARRPASAIARHPPFTESAAWQREGRAGQRGEPEHGPFVLRQDGSGEKEARGEPGSGARARRQEKGQASTEETGEREVGVGRGGAAVLSEREHSADAGEENGDGRRAPPREASGGVVENEEKRGRSAA